MKNEYANIDKFSENIQGRIVDNEADLKVKGMQMGLLGRIFGSAEQSSKNIAGFAAVISLLFAVFISCWTATKSGVPNTEIWNVVTPIITGAFGYLFGQHTKK